MGREAKGLTEPVYLNSQLEFSTGKEGFILQLHNLNDGEMLVDWPIANTWMERLSGFAAYLYIVIAE